MWVSLLVIAAFVLSLSHVVAKLALREIDLRTLLLTRAVAGVVFSLPLLITARCDLTSPGAAGVLGVTILLSPLAINLLFFAGLNWGGIGVQNALRQNSPIFVVGLQWMVFGAPVHPLQVGGAACLVVGTALLFDRRTGGDGWRPFLFGLAAAVAHGGAVVMQDLALEHVNRSGLILIQNVAFLLLMAAGVFVHRKRETLPGPVGFPWRGVALAATSGLMVMILFDFLKLTALSHLGPTVTVSVLLLNLPFAMLMGRWLLKEMTCRRAWIGVGTILVGALLMVW